MAAQINQVVPLVNTEAFQIDFATRLNIAAETFCRLRGLEPFAISAERDYFRTNMQAALSQCAEAFWLAESLRIAGLGGPNAQ